MSAKLNYSIWVLSSLYYSVTIIHFYNNISVNSSQAKRKIYRHRHTVAAGPFYEYLKSVIRYKCHWHQHPPIDGI